MDPGLLQGMAGGYRHDEVEKYLAQSPETIAPADHDRAAALELLYHPVFRRPRFNRPGYAEGTVAAVVDLITRALRREVEMIRKQFEDIHLSEMQVYHCTWDRDEVDACLRAVGAELDRRAAGSPDS